MARLSNYRGVLYCSLALHVALLSYSAFNDSPTNDEIGNLIAGVSHVRFCRFDLGRVNPPLVRVIATAPLAFGSIRVDWSGYDDSEGARSERIVRQSFASLNGERTFRLVSLARLPCIVFSVIGAISCTSWAKELFGTSAGLACLFLWCFSPDVLGHGHLLSSDVPAASMAVAASYFYWKWLRNASVSTALISGGMLGAALLTKFTLLLLLPAWLIAGIASLRDERSPAIIRRRALHSLMISGFAIYVVNVGYCFEGSFRPLEEYTFYSDFLSSQEENHPDIVSRSNRFHNSWVAKCPVPAPVNYLRGIDLQKADFDKPTLSYLNGQWRTQGWWYYYFYAFLLKFPIGGIALLLLSGIQGVLCCRLTKCHTWLILSGTFVVSVLLVASSQSRLNHHFRYILPAFPFLFIWMSSVVAASAYRGFRYAAVACVVAYVGSSAMVYPHSLAYFNEAAGGPIRGHLHLGHSNTDWGQDLLRLRAWIECHPDATPIGVAYEMPHVRPEVAGINYLPVPFDCASGIGQQAGRCDCGPKPGWYAISVNLLHTFNGEYKYFLQRQPVARVGYTINIYHIRDME